MTRLFWFFLAAVVIQMLLLALNVFCALITPGPLGLLNAAAAGFSAACVVDTLLTGWKSRELFRK